ncbi:MAG: hypothetical protein OEL89_02500 [Candidatus Peregrinibacteria bacterium]|nr:hypothetical protein [Candidatus Peregrinibacteria bacterium]
MKFEFTKKAEKEFLNIEKDLQIKIFKKIKFFEKQKAPLHFAKKLQDFVPPQWRFRVAGSYRVRGTWEGEKFTILRISHRSNIYK